MCRSACSRPQNEAAVDYALKTLIEKEQPITIGSVEAIIASVEEIPAPTHITIKEVDLSAYDALLSVNEEVLPCYPMN